MSILLALDPGTSTGYCLVQIEQDEEGYYTDANIYEYGFIDVDITSEYQGDHCISLMERIQELIDRNSVEWICVEDFFFSKRFVNGCNVNAAFRTAIHILARQNGIDYTILNISSWKTFVAGRSTPTKEQKARWGKEPSKKLAIQEALWEWWGFRFPNHSVSESTGKPILFRFDIVDVVGQAVYYCGLICGVPSKRITMSVEVPDDVVFTRNVKKRFIYPEGK
jgi:Holliday junction resolvasome RuvABC endonuclease subunit